MPRNSLIIQFRLQSIRAALAEDSLLKTDSRRKNAFFAAMRQFDEQMAAAKVVTSATRPINLYYGLVQAGYAVCAAKLEGRWQFDHHGLDYRLPGSMCDSLPGVKVLPNEQSKRLGGYQNVSKAVRSEIIQGPVEIGALWSCNPDLGHSYPLGAEPTHKTALLLDPVLDLGNPVITLGEEPTTSFFPHANLSVPGTVPKDYEQWLSELRKAYFGFSEAHLVRPEGDALSSSEGGGEFQAKLRWTTSHQNIDDFFNGFATEHRYEQTRYALPRISGGAPPKPLMLWWLILYTLSNLARYRPREWTSYLALDSSRCAASLNMAMDEALDALPHLVLNALEAQPTLINPRLG